MTKQFLFHEQCYDKYPLSKNPPLALCPVKDDKQCQDQGRCIKDPFLAGQTEMVYHRFCLVYNRQAEWLVMACKNVSSNVRQFLGSALPQYEVIPPACLSGPVS